MFGAPRKHAVSNLFINILIDGGCETVLLVLTCKPYDLMQDGYCALPEQMIRSDGDC